MKGPPLTTIVTDRNELWLCFWLGVLGGGVLCWLVFLPWLVLVISLCGVGFCLLRSILSRQP